MVHYTKSNFVRVRIKDRIYDYILSISHHAFFFLLVDEYFIMGQIDRSLPEDILKFQFIFKDEIFRGLDEVNMLFGVCLDGVVGLLRVDQNFWICWNSWIFWV